MNEDAPVCRLWWARLGDYRPGLRDLLDPVEIGRADAYRRRADHDRFVIGVALTRLAAQRLWTVPADEADIDRTCEHCGLPHGRPRYTGRAAGLSISHSGDLIGLAVHTGGRVGLDVEQVAPDRAATVESMLTDAERHDLAGVPPAERPGVLFGYWVRKEAVLKTTGDGLMVPMTRITVTGPGRPAAVLAFDGGPDDLALTDLAVPDGYRAALSVHGTTPPIVELPGTDLLSQD